jgi:hypothetical protein
MSTPKDAPQVAAFGIAILLLAACAGQPAGGSPPTSPVTEGEARAMTQNMLEAYNAADYGAWSRDWSQVMKDAIPEQAFLDFQRQSMANTGDFEAIENITSRPGQDPGVTRWESTVRFENGTYVFMIAFNEGSKLIEGVDLSPQ